MRRDRPIYSVKCYPEGKKGRALDLSERVLSFMYLDRSTKADRLELKVNNSDLRYFDDPVWRKGVILEVSWGYPGNMSEPALCVIKKVTGGTELTVEAFGQGILLHQIKKCRVFKNTTIAQLLAKFQDEYQSILVVAKIPDLNKQVSGLGEQDKKLLITQLIHLQQAAQTDAEFLQRTARKFGLVFSVDKKGVIGFHDPGEHMKKPPTRTITWRGGTGDWESFQIDNDLTALLGAVTTKAIDTKTKGVVEGRADNKATARPGLMPVQEAVCKAEPVSEQTGQTRYRTEACSSIETTTAGEAGKEHVQAKAEGKFKASQRATIKLEGSLIGDPYLSAKQNIVVKGLGKRCSGVYHLIQVRHEIAHHGKYVTHFVAKGDGHGGYQEGNNVPSEASPNTQKPNDDPSVTTVVRSEPVSHITGQTHYEFHVRGK